VEERLRVMRTVEGRIVQLAQHKYASNVVEKCVEKSNEADRRTVVLVTYKLNIYFYCEKFCAVLKLKSTVSYLACQAKY
jgi:hypothetical protein